MEAYVTLQVNARQSLKVQFVYLVFVIVSIFSGMNHFLMEPLVLRLIATTSFVQTILSVSI